MSVLAAALFLAAGCAPSQLSEKETLAKFQELDREAQAAFDAHQYAAAAQRYRETACLVPKSARAFYGLGIAEAAAHNFPAARKALETAYAILPENMMPLAMLVRVNVAMHDIEKVKEVLRTAAQRFPKDGELHSSLSRFLAENQLLDLALAESLRFEQAGSSDTGSTVALAVLENTVGAYDDAIRNAAAIESQPGAPDSVKASAAGVAGLSYESIGQREEAVKHLRLAIQLAPQQENSYLALADLYEKAQRFKEAADVLQEGRKRIPGSPNLLLPLGNNLVWSEQFQAGVDVLNELLHKSNDAAEAYLRLAEAYRKMGRPDQEVETLRKLARVKPGHPMIHVLTAQAMLTLDPVDYPKVLAELAQAQKTTPNDPDIFYLRGKVYLATNAYQYAVAALKRAIELRPMEPGPYYQLGLTYRKLGQADLAKQVLDRMTQLRR
jgi:tetratricopeptide (TPR) repeat protein